LSAATNPFPVHLHYKRFCPPSNRSIPATIYTTTKSSAATNPFLVHPHYKQIFFRPITDLFPPLSTPQASHPQQPIHFPPTHTTNKFFLSFNQHMNKKQTICALAHIGPSSSPFITSFKNKHNKHATGHLHSERNLICFILNKSNTITHPNFQFYLDYRRIDVLTVDGITTVYSLNFLKTCTYAWK